MKNLSLPQIKSVELKGLMMSILIVSLLACSSGKKTVKAEKTETTLIEVDEKESKKQPNIQFDSQESEYVKNRLSTQGEQSVNGAVAHVVKRHRLPVRYIPPVNTEKYHHNPENGVKSVIQNPVSTFSIDVDTGSYTNVRRMINQGILPPEDAVRVEEFINYFDYKYKTEDLNVKTRPFSIQTNVATSPWDKGRHIMRIGLKGVMPDANEIAGRNLVFLLDVSGSMSHANKLPLLTRSLELLSKQLNARDSVSIVVYAGASGVVLKPTKGDQTSKIKQALNALTSGGSTNGQAGIELAYSMAEEAFIKKGVNRVILATDGDFNVGITNHQRLIELIKAKRQKGIALTTLGFGQGNYNDHLMESLADAGNGNYAYIDNIHEARKVLVDEMNGTLLTIAKDVKIQVEFNPNQVSEYRLIGYENRALKREDFNNDNVDAGEIGAGHTVTAFYELVLKDSHSGYLDALRYQIGNDGKRKRQGDDVSHELALVKLRYKTPGERESKLATQPVFFQDIKAFDRQPNDFRFASAVVGFAHLLKKSNYWQNMSYRQIAELAQSAKGADEYGYRAEFINLVRTSGSLQASQIEQTSEDHIKIQPNSPKVASDSKEKFTLLSVK